MRMVKDKEKGQQFLYRQILFNGLSYFYKKKKKS
jgi:hypothetical protein